MVEREMTEPLTHRSTARPRPSQQHALACEPTFPARHAQTTLTQRARSLRLAPPHDTHVAPLALPSVDAPPTPLGPPTYPSGAGLGRLITLLASEPEPDKLPAYLMRDMAERLGADGAYLFRTDAASKTLALAPWAIVDGAIQHRDTMPGDERGHSQVSHQPRVAEAGSGRSDAGGADRAQARLRLPGLTTLSLDFCRCVLAVNPGHDDALAPPEEERGRGKRGKAGETNGANEF